MKFKLQQPTITQYRGCIALILLTLCFYSTQARANNVICFYSPESNIKNMKMMDKSFNAYFAKVSDASFHPFAHEAELEQFSTQQGCDLFILSNGYYQKNKTKMSLVKKMDGILHGKPYQNKVLSMDKGQGQQDGVALLQEKTIASSTSIVDARKELLTILGSAHENIVRSIQILEVPKDIDALMAIHYGVASAALTTDSSLELFGSLNPKQARKLKRVGGEVQSPFPVIALNKEGNHGQTLLTLLRTMHESSAGKGKLRLLGLDSFLDATDKEGK